MPPALDIPPLVDALCAERDIGAVVAAEPLAGGIICATRRLRTARGATLVVKQDRGCPPDFFRREAEALAAIAAPGWRVPTVLAVDHGCLVLEDLGARTERRADYWVELGRAWARLHGRIAGRFGYGTGTYYGRFAQDNAWRADGWRFYAETRFLPWLDRPRCRAALDARDRADLERVATRLPLLIPAQGPALLHGDLWCGNLLVDRDGGPAVVDPSPLFGWPEADLHNAQMFGGFDAAFFDAYREAHPLEPGWRERLELLYLPHLLGMIEHECDVAESVAWTRALLRRFA